MLHFAQGHLNKPESARIWALPNSKLPWESPDSHHLKGVKFMAQIMIAEY